MKEKLSINEAMEQDITVFSEMMPLDTTRTETMTQVAQSYSLNDPVKCL